MVPILNPALNPEPEETTRCQFCSYQGKLTREHVWPEAFKTYFPEVDRLHHQRFDFDIQGQQAGHEWDAPAFNSTVAIDCKACNNQHLRRIEKDAATWIWGMTRGIRRRTLLTLTTQRKLAAFTLRMVAVGQYTRPQLRPVPRAHREYLITHRAPPPLVEVWAFYYEGNDQVFRIQAGPQGISGPGESPVGPNAYRGVLRMGHLVLEIAARTDNLPYPFRPPDPRTFIPLWPIELNRVGIWPPERMLDDAELEGRLRGGSDDFVWVIPPTLPGSQ